MVLRPIIPLLVASGLDSQGKWAAGASAVYTLVPVTDSKTDFYLKTDAGFCYVFATSQFECLAIELAPRTTYSLVSHESVCFPFDSGWTEISIVLTPRYALLSFPSPFLKVTPIADGPTLLQVVGGSSKWSSDTRPSLSSSTAGVLVYNKDGHNVTYTIGVYPTSSTSS